MKVALIGAGRWAETLCRVLGESFASVEIAYLVREKSERPAWLPASAEMLSSPDLLGTEIAVDAALIATGPDVSIPIAQQLLARGVACYVEKPLMTSSVPLGPEFDGPVPFLVGHQHAFGLVVEEVRSRIHFGMDEIDTVHVRSYGPGPTRTYDPIFDYGSHALAVLFYMTGRPLALIGTCADTAVWSDASGARYIVEAGNDRSEKRFDVLVRFRSGGVVRYDGRDPSSVPLQRALATFFRAVTEKSNLDERFGSRLPTLVDGGCQAWILRRRLQDVAAIQQGWCPTDFGVVDVMRMIDQPLKPLQTK